MRVVTKQNFRIAGSGSYLPEIKVTAPEMDARCRLPVGWCEKNIGVFTRYECRSPESMVSMACNAMNLALEDANLDWDAIDMIIDCSTSQYRPIPCNAAHYANAIHSGKVIGVGSSDRILGIPCFDVHSTCLSSLVAINMLNSMMATDSYRNIMVVSSESGLGGVNYAEAESACLIGDGAAALVISRQLSNSVYGYAHHTLPNHVDDCCVDGGGHKRPVFEYSSEVDSYYRFTMDGPSIFRIAMEHLKPMVDDLLLHWSDNQTSSYKGIHIVPHQASPRALRTVKRIFQSDLEHFHVAVHEIGNLVAASLPTMIDRVRKSGAIQPGETVLAMGTSAGYSQAAMFFTM